MPPSDKGEFPFLEKKIQEIFKTIFMRNEILNEIKEIPGHAQMHFLANSYS